MQVCAPLAATHSSEQPLPGEGAQRGGTGSMLGQDGGGAGCELGAGSLEGGAGSTSGCMDSSGGKEGTPGWLHSVPGWTLPEHLVLLSVPAAEHSRKPGLSGLMAGLVAAEPSSPMQPHAEPNAESEPCGELLVEPPSRPLAASGCSPGSYNVHSISTGGRVGPERGGLDRVGAGCADERLQGEGHEAEGGCEGEAGQDAATVMFPVAPLRWGLELFAREMHAGWDSVGNEVLLFQHCSLFKPNCDD